MKSIILRDWQVRATRHGPGAWERNDWVWVYDYERVGHD